MKPMNFPKKGKFIDETESMKSWNTCATPQGLSRLWNAVRPEMQLHCKMTSTKLALLGKQV